MSGAKGVQRAGWAWNSDLSYAAIGEQQVSDTVYRLPRVERFGDRSVDGQRYTSEDHLAAEIERVFKRAWIVVAQSSAVAKPGHVAVLKEEGVDVIVLRDDKGQLQAFQNRCMHRGSRLVHKSGPYKRFECDYHGWRYGLDGALESAPDADGFGGVDVCRIHLETIRVTELAGQIWVCLDRTQPELEQQLSGIADELSPYQLEDMEPIQERVFSVPVNWKSMLENAFDYYHVGKVHKRTVHAHVTESPEIALYGDHIRQNIHIAPYRWRELIDRRCSRGGPYTARQHSRLFKYTLFPNTMINVLPYHMSVMRVWPDGVGGTRLHYSFCQRRGARGVEWLRARGTWLASRIILAEDVRMLARCQSQMDASVVPQHLLHDFEAASAHFHDVLGKWMTQIK